MNTKTIGQDTLKTSPQSIHVTDDGGAHITLAQPAVRIIALAPNLTGLVYAAGAG